MKGLRTTERVLESPTQCASRWDCPKSESDMLKTYRRYRELETQMPRSGCAPAPWKMVPSSDSFKRIASFSGCGRVGNVYLRDSFAGFFTTYPHLVSRLALDRPREFLTSGSSDVSP